VGSLSDSSVAAAVLDCDSLGVVVVVLGCDSLVVDLENVADQPWDPR
jgi:hypothetical protein